MVQTFTLSYLSPFHMYFTKLANHLNENNIYIDTYVCVRVCAWFLLQLNTMPSETVRLDLFSSVSLLQKDYELSWKFIDLENAAGFACKIGDVSRTWFLSSPFD